MVSILFMNVISRNILFQFLIFITSFLVSFYEGNGMKQIRFIRSYQISKSNFKGLTSVEIILFKSILQGGRFFLESLDGV